MASTPVQVIVLYGDDISGITYKIKKNTKMSKVFDNFCRHKNIQRSMVRFLLDGKRIGEDDTFKTLEMEDRDKILCMSRQEGGC